MSIPNTADVYQILGFGLDDLTINLLADLKKKSIRRNTILYTHSISAEQELTKQIGLFDLNNPQALMQWKIAQKVKKIDSYNTLYIGTAEDFSKPEYQNFPSYQMISPPITVDSLLKKLDVMVMMAYEHRQIEDETAKEDTTIFSEAEAPQAAQETRYQRINVLAIDNDTVFIKLLQTLCQQLDIPNEQAASGDAALNLFQNTYFDLVFLDIKYSEIKDTMLAKKIKQLYQSPRIILLTAQNSALNKVKAQIIGCDGFLVKPVASEVLEKQIRHYVAQLFPEQDNYF